MFSINSPGLGQLSLLTSPMDPSGTIATGANLPYGITSIKIISLGYVYIYVTNFNSSKVSIFSISSTGRLTSLSVPVSTGGNNPYGITSIIINGVGYVYVTNANSNNISMFSIISTPGQVGQLFLLGTILTGGSYPSAITSIIINGVGYIYVANQTSNSVSMFSINSSTGQLTLLTASPYIYGTISTNSTVSNAITSIILNGVGYVYVANASAPGTVSMFSINSTGNIGQLTLLTASPYTNGTILTNGSLPNAITSIILNGVGYVYVTNTGAPSTVSMFSINSSGNIGQLTLLTASPYTNGRIPTGGDGLNRITSCIINSIGYVYVTNANSNTVSMFSINSTGNIGQLTLLTSPIDPSGTILTNGIYPRAITNIVNSIYMQ